MSSHRNLRVAQAIREVVASAILFETADPRIRSVTVLRVEVSADLRQATVHVTVMGNEAEQSLALRGLKHAAGFFQSKVAARLQTRFTPVLTFKLDDSVKKSVEMSRLIAEAVASDLKPDRAAGEPSPASDANLSPDADPDGDVPPVPS
ncbi:MAG: 30S ribosome-binding factor RbfA [Isosphaeraceae bacterium]|jgi:ribosome-binding factor A